MQKANQDVARDIALVGQLESVPTILQVLCDVTGMGFAAVARVTQGSWTACAVLDQIGFGLLPGGQLDVDTTLCKEVRASGQPVVIEHASLDPLYAAHHTPRLYAIESYVSVPVVLPDGEYFGNLCAIDPRPAKVGAPGILAMFVHFAELIARQLLNERRALAMQSALLEARSARDLRDQLVGMLGQDLRGPIGLMALSSQRLKAKAADPSAVLRIAADIASQAQRAGTLIDKVLDVTRGPLGSGLSAEPVQVEGFGEALFGVVTALQSAHPGRDIEWQFNIARPVRLDRARIQQLADHLLRNALEHSAPDGKIKITATAADAHEFSLSVWNEGAAIAPDKLADLFAPVWRRATADRDEGLGLGLHISALIAQAHGGTLSVGSADGVGTTFTAVMPA